MNACEAYERVSSFCPKKYRTNLELVALSSKVNADTENEGGYINTWAWLCLQGKAWFLAMDEKEYPVDTQENTSGVQR